MTNDNEQWRPIAGFDGYEISNHGRVRNPAGAIMKIGKNASTKKLVFLTRNRKQFARSVTKLQAAAFPVPETAEDSAKRQELLPLLWENLKVIYAGVYSVIGEQRKHRVEEVFDLAFNQAVKSLPKYKAQNGAKLSTWLYRVARYAALSWLRDESVKEKHGLYSGQLGDVDWDRTTHHDGSELPAKSTHVPSMSDQEKALESFAPKMRTFTSQLSADIEQEVVREESDPEIDEEEQHEEL
jgi:DNA-directed RNA polymerase specialized sigma24 family protein